MRRSPGDVRPNGTVTPAQLADFEAGLYPALRAQRDQARATTLDDDLPLNPLEHLDETRSTLRRFPAP